MSIIWLINKMWHYPFNRILLTFNIADIDNMDEPWNYAKWNKPNTKIQTVYECLEICI
jgi:hypothetical protein